MFFILTISYCYQDAVLVAKWDIVGILHFSDCRNIFLRLQHCLIDIAWCFEWEQFVCACKSTKKTRSSRFFLSWVFSLIDYLSNTLLSLYLNDLFLCRIFPQREHLQTLSSVILFFTWLSWTFWADFGKSLILLNWWAQLVPSLWCFQ
jgi:hypothetical protein